MKAELKVSKLRNLCRTNIPIEKRTEKVNKNSTKTKNRTIMVDFD